MKERIYTVMPNFLQCLLISVFNFLAYKKRYGGRYSEYRKLFKERRYLGLDELKIIQEKRFESFLKYVKNTSEFYKNYDLVSISNINTLPIVTKEIIRSNIDKIYTRKKNDGVVSKTGGTTGKSLEVIFTKDNMQERFAMLDDFRGRYGYELGKKTAWFSGKNLLSPKDIKINRFWKTDYYYNVRYYSTFHIKEEYLQYYLADLVKFRPEYFVGFPSTMFELAKYGIAKGIDFPKDILSAIFPTAETISEPMRQTIESFFKCKMYNQYASSEGAPFIFECSEGKLHMELQSGIFEVLDSEDNDIDSGRLVFTSFSSEGTPLIRYDIGDQISIDNSALNCKCGNSNPIVKEILGRTDDFVYSPERGKIFLGNVSNCVKDVQGIIKFQVQQFKINEINILIVIDEKKFQLKDKQMFLENWYSRVGLSMLITLDIVNDIPVEKSGKFRIVKSEIKDLI